MFYKGFRSWPPMWVQPDNPTKRPCESDENGVLTQVTMHDLAECRISLRMEDDNGDPTPTKRPQIVSPSTLKGEILLTADENARKFNSNCFISDRLGSARLRGMDGFILPQKKRK
jgi:hypothetical protein